MTMQTTTLSSPAPARKGRDGWEAKNKITLAGRRAIEVSTYKTYKGLGTCFQVGTNDGDFFSIDLMGDFREYLLAPAGLKATEKNVNEYHRAAIAVLPAVMARALAHYVAKDAKSEAVADQAEDTAGAMDDVNYVGHACHY